MIPVQQPSQDVPIIPQENPFDMAMKLASLQRQNQETAANEYKLHRLMSFNDHVNKNPIDYNDPEARLTLIKQFPDLAPEHLLKVEDDLKNHLAVMSNRLTYANEALKNVGPGDVDRFRQVVDHLNQDPYTAMAMEQQGLGPDVADKLIDQHVKDGTFNAFQNAQQMGLEKATDRSVNAINLGNRTVVVATPTHGGASVQSFTAGVSPDQDPNLIHRQEVARKEGGLKADLEKQAIEKQNQSEATQKSAELLKGFNLYHPNTAAPAESFGGKMMQDIFNSAGTNQAVQQNAALQQSINNTLGQKSVLPVNSVAAQAAYQKTSRLTAEQAKALYDAYNALKGRKY